MSKLTFGSTGRTGRSDTTGRGGRRGRNYEKLAVSVTLDQAAWLRAVADDRPHRTVSEVVRLAVTRLRETGVDLDELLDEQAHEEARGSSRKFRETPTG